MTESPRRTRVSEAALMNALAHPLRSRLVHHLMAVGPRTASECAEAVGASPSNCSWHLRKLAGLGLVEPAEGTDGRQRPWRACDVGLDLGEFDDDPAVLSAQLAAVGNALREEQALTQRFLDDAPNAQAAWPGSTPVDGYSLHITPSELSALVAAVDALVHPYIAGVRDAVPTEAGPVYVGFRAFPRIEGGERASERADGT